MSKDITRKTDPRSTNPASNKPGAPRPTASGKPTGSAGSRPPAGRTPAPGSRPPTMPARGGMARSGGGPQGKQNITQPGKGSGFGNRDVTLLIGGVMVVVFVVVGALILGNMNKNNSAASTNTTDTAGSTAPTPNVALEPSTIATLTASASNPSVQAAQTALASHTNITPVPKGRPAPDFTYPATDGKTYTLSQFKGQKPVLVEFMAPWCPHCQKDSVILNQVYDAFKGKNLQMLSVSAHPYGRDWEEKQGNISTSSPITMDDLTWFRDTYKVPYPMLLDKMVKSADDYGIAYFPTLYIINQDGTVFEEMQAETNNPLSFERISGELNKVVK